MQLQLYGKKIWVFKGPIDFRKSMDGLSSLIMNDIKQDPKSGIFLFYNKGKDKIKCLSWHKNGFVLIYKRLEKGKFCFNFNKEQGVSEMNMDELSWLLAGLEWQKMRHWNELSYDKFS
jgi:transposase